MCKKTYLILLTGLLLTGLTLVGCRSNSSYPNLLKAEKKLIDNYVDRNGLEIVDYEPTAEEFAANPNLYYKMSGFDRFYYHLDSCGKSDGDTIKESQKAIVRYKQFTLTELPDTASNWNTLDSSEPMEFSFWRDMYASSPVACTAWHYAILHMMYLDSYCTIIVPSKYGFTSDQSTVTPYGYKLHLKFHP